MRTLVIGRVDSRGVGSLAIVMMTCKSDIVPHCSMPVISLRSLYCTLLQRSFRGVEFTRLHSPDNLGVCLPKA